MQFKQLEQAWKFSLSRHKAIRLLQVSGFSQPRATHSPSRLRWRLTVTDFKPSRAHSRTTSLTSTSETSTQTISNTPSCSSSILFSSSRSVFRSFSASPTCEPAQNLCQQIGRSVLPVSALTSLDQRCSRNLPLPRHLWVLSSMRTVPSTEFSAVLPPGSIK